MHSRTRAARVAVIVALLAGLPASACKRSDPKPQHRERASIRDVDCKDPARPSAFFYPAENRTDYGPDDPKADGCVLDVPDHVFCCPDKKRPSDR